MDVGESGFLLLDMTMKIKQNSCLWDFLPQDAHHCYCVTVWQNSTEYYCAASADIVLQLVAKSDYVLY